MALPMPKSNSLWVPVTGNDVEEAVEHFIWMFRAVLDIGIIQKTLWGFRYTLFKPVVHAYALHRLKVPQKAQRVGSFAHQTMNKSTPT